MTSPHLSLAMIRFIYCLAVLFLSCTVHATEIKRVDVPIGNSPATGPPDAPVTIIEFIDFQ